MGGVRPKQSGAGIVPSRRGPAQLSTGMPHPAHGMVMPRRDVAMPAYESASGRRGRWIRFMEACLCPAAGAQAAIGMLDAVLTGFTPGDASPFRRSSRTPAGKRVTPSVAPLPPISASPALPRGCRLIPATTEFTHFSLLMKSISVKFDQILRSTTGGNATRIGIGRHDDRHCDHLPVNRSTQVRAVRGRQHHPAHGEPGTPFGCQSYTIHAKYVLSGLCMDVPIPMWDLHGATQECES
ncbi:hypothetical protein SAMN03159338_0868 [Sphingomonas sp. NFR04]|nr:hypothetical protein SAMN03159338_0868 [Sphingomonas sp. NFR04]